MTPRLLLAAALAAAWFVHPGQSSRPSAATLPSCVAGLEGAIFVQNGGTNTGGATAFCLCTSSGAASPTFQWCSLKAVIGAAMVATCLGGSAAVCP